MTVQLYDIQAEETLLKSMIHGVCFDEIYFNAEPTVFFGKKDGDEGRSLTIVEVVKLIRDLRDTLHEIPTPEIVCRNYKDWLERNAPDQSYKRLAYIEKLAESEAPTEVASKYAIKQVEQCYDNRMANETLEECLEIFEEDGGSQAMSHMRESVARRSRDHKSNFKIVDYKDDYKIRERHQHDAQAGVSEVKRVPFGIRGLDLATGGAGRGEVVYIVASSGRGKSLMMKDICANMMMNHGQRAVFFTKEMTTMETGFRYDARFSGVRHPKFFENVLAEDDYVAWDEAMTSVPDNHLKIVEFMRNFSISEVEKALDVLAWEFKPDVVFLDYVGLMEPSARSRGDGHYRAYEMICREIKDFIKERNLMGIAASQLKTQSSEKLEITFDDIFIGKNVLVQNADVVAALLSDEWMRELNRAVLQILKVRGKTPDMTKFDIFPDYDRIRIDTGIATDYTEKPRGFNSTGINIINEEGLPVFYEN